MTTASPKLVVFDLDGTLIDSRRDLAKSVNATLEHCSRADLPGAQIANYIGNGASMLVQRSLEATGGCDPALLERAMIFFLNYYRHHLLDHTHVYDGVLEALFKIRRAAPALCMAVLTNKPVRPSKRICDALGLSPYLFANYGGDSFNNKKPDPEGLLVLMRQASTGGQMVLPEETIMVGDSDVDVRTGKAAGTRTVGCLYGFAPETVRLAEPDVLVSSPKEWLAAFGLR